MEKVLILGTGNAQIDLIEYCKEKGYDVHGCSYTHGDNGEALLDKFACINITDIEALEKYIKDEKIRIVYSVGSDMAMPSVAKICEDLNINHFVSSKTAILCNQKNELRAFLGNDFKGNIPFQEMTSDHDQVVLQYPLMLKPTDSQGQRGVFKINSDEEFKLRVNESLSYSKSGKVIAEEFIDGEEISVNTFSVNGKCVFKLISDRIVWEEFPGGIIHKHVIPSKYDNKETKTKIEDLVERVLKKLEILNGPAYFQIKIRNGNEPILVEVTPRLDGCHMWKLIKYYCGVDLLEMAFHHLLENLDITEKISIKPMRENVVLEFMCQPTDTSVCKHDFDVTASDYYRWYYNDNDTVKKMNGYMEKCGYQIGEQKK